MSLFTTLIAFWAVASRTQVAVLNMTACLLLGVENTSLWLSEMLETPHTHSLKARSYIGSAIVTIPIVPRPLPGF